MALYFSFKFNGALKMKRIIFISKFQVLSTSFNLQMKKIWQRCFNGLLRDRVSEEKSTLCVVNWLQVFGEE